MKNFNAVAITGASRGLGAALAIELARQASKSLNGETISLFLAARQMSKLEDVAQKCRLLGADVHIFELDVRDEKACARWVRDIEDKGRGLDLVIANAGISGGTGATASSTDDDRDRSDIIGESIADAQQIFEVNWTGVLNTIHPAVEVMSKYATKDQRGHVAILSSVAGFRGMPGAPAYCASKAAVKSYGESLRANLEPYSIDVSVICPGFVKSDMTDANDFKMPFLMSAERAARIMVKGMKKKKGRIVFPLPMAFASWLMRSLPDRFVHFLTRKTPSKPPLTS